MLQVNACLETKYFKQSCFVFVSFFLFSFSNQISFTFIIQAITLSVVLISEKLMAVVEMSASPPPSTPQPLPLPPFPHTRLPTPTLLSVFLWTVEQIHFSCLCCFYSHYRIVLAFLQILKVELNRFSCSTYIWKWNCPFQMFLTNQAVDLLSSFLSHDYQTMSICSEQYEVGWAFLHQTATLASNHSALWCVKILIVQCCPPFDVASVVTVMILLCIFFVFVT